MMNPDELANRMAEVTMWAPDEWSRLMDDSLRGRPAPQRIDREALRTLVARHLWTGSLDRDVDRLAEGILALSTCPQRDAS